MQCLLSAQSWALVMEKQLSQFPVLKVTVLAAVTGVWMEQSLSQHCWSRLSQRDAGFLKQSSGLLVAQI